MKRILPLFLLTLLQLTACGKSFHADFTGKHGTVRLNIELGGPQYADLTFTLDGIGYTVASVPTVDNPTLVLQSADGRSLALDMPASAEAEAALHLTADDGTAREYTCSAAELEPLLDWMKTN